MATAREIAAQVLPHFAENVLAGRRLTYGRYAHLIGRDVATEAITIGQVMHLIGVLCVFRQLPVAPLYFVKRAVGEARQIFASDPTESLHVLPHFDNLYVVAREYQYSEEDFEGINTRLHKVLLEKAPPDWTPHHLWHLAIWKCPENSEQTYFQRALSKYECIIDELRKQRSKRG